MLFISVSFILPQWFPLLHTHTHTHTYSLPEWVDDCWEKLTGDWEISNINLCFYSRPVWGRKMVVENPKKILVSWNRRANIVISFPSFMLLYVSTSFCTWVNRHFVAGSEHSAPSTCSHQDITQGCAKINEDGDH